MPRGQLFLGVRSTLEFLGVNFSFHVFHLSAQFYKTEVYLFLHHKNMQYTVIFSSGKNDNFPLKKKMTFSHFVFVTLIVGTQ